jgi:hypothetical protein
MSIKKHDVRSAGLQDGDHWLETTHTRGHNKLCSVGGLRKSLLNTLEEENLNASLYPEIRSRGSFIYNTIRFWEIL